MSRYPHRLNAALLVLLFGLFTTAGCQRQSAPAVKTQAPVAKEEAAATGQLVTVDVPGMT